MFGPRVQPETLEAAHRLALKQNVNHLITGVTAFHDRQSHAEFVSRWNGHLVLVSGIHDRTPTAAAAAASVVGLRYEQVIVEDCGHYVPLGQPDAFYAILTDLVARMSRA